MSWRDKKCVITGGSAGLGLALARRAAALGLDMLICGRDPERLRGAVESLAPTASGRVQSMVADVTRQEDCERLCDNAQGRLGGIDLLANCAGASGRSALLETDVEDFQRMWELNFLAPVRLTRLLADNLIARRGHVVNIGSLASKTAPRYMGAYPATKFALAAYTQQLRLELGPRGVHSLLVCPGPIARDDAGRRYSEAADGLPDSARRPGAGAKLSAVDPAWLAAEIFKACEKGRAELVTPRSARLLFAIAQLSPRLGDWLLERKTSD